jgi:serine/threonine-protein kinase
MLDWRISLRLAIHLAHALAYAHQQNILHRNLTPPNVLVRKQDRVAKLGDLMQVKALEGTLAVQLTRPGHVVGHLPYAAPETLENSANADHRSDIYALGALVYAVLTGRPPIEGSSLADVFVKIRTNDPPPPRKFQPNVPEHFEGAVRRMLAKRPEERFQSTVELLELLESIARFQGLVV